MEEIKIPKAIKGKFCGPKEHKFKYLGGDCVCMKCGYFVTPTGKLYRRADKGDEGYVQDVHESVETTLGENELMTEGCHHYPDNVGIGMKNLKIIGDKIVADKVASNNILASIENTINTNNIMAAMTKSFTSIRILPTNKGDDFDLMILLDESQKTVDFVQRFVDGRETLSDRIAASPILRIMINPNILTKMESGIQLPRLFKSLFEYCNHGIDTYSDIMFEEIMNSGYVFKELVKSTKLMGLVTLPLSAILVIDDVDINDKHPICCCEEDKDYCENLNGVRYLISQARLLLDKPISSETTRLISLGEPLIKKPETPMTKEESDKIDDILASLKKIVGNHNLQFILEHTKSNRELIEGLQTFIEGGYNGTMVDIADKFISENVEKVIFTEASNNRKIKVKKLKKIPADIIPYILIEAEAIRDANDKMMIASYAYAKMELIDFYLEVLETGSKRYIVPHNKPYLENLKRQLQAAIKKIMDTPVPTSNSPIIKIEYPNGYEG